jgi:hypothetical protein
MKVAGIDVHKKVLMVVVVDARMREEKPARRQFVTMSSELHRLLTWLREQGSGGDRVDCAALAVSVDGTGAPHAFALGAGVFQPCSTWA